MSDIVETLRKGEAESVDGWWFVMAEAANEIERLRAENEKLREALKPFADAVTDEYSWKYDVNSDDFRAARKALGET